MSAAGVRATTAPTGVAPVGSRVRPSTAYLNMNGTVIFRPLLTQSKPIANARRPRKPCSGFHRYPNSVFRISRSDSVASSVATPPDASPAWLPAAGEACCFLSDPIAASLRPGTLAVLAASPSCRRWSSEAPAIKLRLNWLSSHGPSCPAPHWLTCNCRGCPWLLLRPLLVHKPKPRVLRVLQPGCCDVVLISRVYQVASVGNGSRCSCSDGRACCCSRLASR
mmetsp:Transcript_113/g.371  ORF Transcript_113/g.371 Transcript_113/m.371 type:complete len:223 (+) Transcript_113:1320-1988(+)